MVAHCTNLDSPEHYLFFSSLPQCHGSWLSNCTLLAALLGMSMLMCLKPQSWGSECKSKAQMWELKVSTSVGSQSQSVLMVGETLRQVLLWMHQKYFFSKYKGKQLLLDLGPVATLLWSWKQSASMQTIHLPPISTGPAAHLGFSIAEVCHLHLLLILTVSVVLLPVKLQETKCSFFLCSNPTFSTESYAHSLLFL